MLLDSLKIGAQLEDMIQTEGWEYIENWIKGRGKVITAALKGRKFQDLSEVIELQAELKAYAMLVSEVKHRIEQARKARENLN
jgi:hypothetical protein